MKIGDPTEDYTKKRKGKFIKACPKCGRNGNVLPMGEKDGVTRVMYVHRKELVSGYGTSYWRITDACHVTEGGSQNTGA